MYVVHVWSVNDCSGSAVNRFEMIENCYQLLMLLMQSTRLSNLKADS